MRRAPSSAALARSRGPSSYFRDAEAPASPPVPPPWNVDTELWGEPTTRTRHARLSPKVPMIIPLSV